MRPEAKAHGDAAVVEFVQRMDGVGAGPAAREAYRDSFTRLRSQLEMYPASGRQPSVVFDSAAETATRLAASCLPLGLAASMHLYPLCALQCMPLPLLSVARLQRAVLLRTIRKRSLILANAGSERTRGAGDLVLAHQNADGIHIDGTFEYMSLASVADIVFFKARVANSDCTALCAADLRGETVRVGDWKFSGRMRLSDTSSVTFVGHRVPRGRYVLATNERVLSCASDYQRCWFHLFLAEVYLARLERLHRLWGLRRSAEQTASVNELAALRAHALRLFDDFSSGADLEPLLKTTSALKLRVSVMAQATRTVLLGLAALKPLDARQLRDDADELGYIKWQPTADHIILSRLGRSLRAARRIAG
jgi:hypothetical protein